MQNNCVHYERFNLKGFSDNLGLSMKTRKKMKNIPRNKTHT